MDISLLNELLVTIHSKKTNFTDKSYTAKLFAGGLEKITKKIGEEATEVVIAALIQDDAAVVSEIADLLYHLSVLLAVKNLDWNAVADKLAARQGISGLEEKKSRAEK